MTPEVADFYKSPADFYHLSKKVFVQNHLFAFPERMERLGHVSEIAPIP